jgi:hypothetical protein
LIALEVAPSALPLRLAIGLVPVFVNLALLLPSAPAHALLIAAIGCQCVGTGGFFIYAIVVETKTEMAEDAARATRHAAEALRKLLDGMNADTPIEEFFQHTCQAFDASRDQVVAAAIAKKPNLEAELIAALHGDANARWGARPSRVRPNSWPP